MPSAAHALNGSPNAALVADAGPFAHDVARIFPRPHAQYFAAEPPRRRVTQLVAAKIQNQRAHEEVPRAREALQFWSLKRVLAAFAPDAPQGLAEALKKLDGPAWNQTDYGRLLKVLREGGHGPKTLAHAVIIDRGMLAVLAHLQPQLRRPRILAQLPAPSVAELTARAATRACGHDDARALERLGARIERARSMGALFRMLVEEIGVEQLAPPPIPGADWLKPIATAHAIESAALRFENCLRGRIPWLLMGKGAYYEVVGEEPAIVEIVRDTFGLWVVGEVRGFANCAVSHDLLRRVHAHLAEHGARVAGAKPDALALQLAQAAAW